MKQTISLVALLLNGFLGCSSAPGTTSTPERNEELPPPLPEL